MLGGSWVVISGVVSRVTIVITQIWGLITPLITTHEPPSAHAFKLWDTDLIRSRMRSSGFVLRGSCGLSWVLG